MWRIGVGIAGVLLLLTQPLLATTVEIPRELQGRRNPFRPLIETKRLPDLPSPDPLDASLPAMKPASILERLEYAGIAYDESEAIGVVSDGDRTWFVRLGDRLEGATVTSITPDKLTWNRQGRLIVKSLRREGVR